MTWFRVDDDLPFHRKVVMAGNAAMGLWVRAGAWSSQQLTDGFVPDDMIALMGTPAQRRKLIASRLWIEVDGGCQFHEWNETGRQPTSRSVREKRAAAADRQEKYRASLSRSPQVNGSRNAVTDASVTDDVTPVLTPAPSRPVPRTTSAASASAANGARPDLTVVRDEPAQGSLLPEQTITAQDCAGAWVDSYRAAYDAQPTKQQIGQAARECKSLIAAGNPSDRVLAVAQSAGESGYATVQRQYSLQAKRQSNRPAAVPALPRDPDTALADLRDRADAIAAGELLGRSYIEPSKPPSDPTPMAQWRRDRAVEFIDDNEPAIRAALTARRVG